MRRDYPSLASHPMIPTRGLSRMGPTTVTSRGRELRADVVLTSPRYKKIKITRPVLNSCPETAAHSRALLTRYVSSSSSRAQATPPPMTKRSPQRTSLQMTSLQMTSLLMISLLRTRVRVLRTSSKSWWSSVTHSIGRAMLVDLSPTTRAQTIQVGTMAIVAPAI